MSLVKAVAIGGSLAVAGVASTPAVNVAGAATGARAAAATVVKVASSKYGKIIVAADGHTLYMYKADKGTTSECYGGCASYWPALLTKRKPTAGSGVVASKLGTTKRSNGTLQVTYAGHPLYYYGGDQTAGTENGQGSGGVWYVLAPSGAVITKAAASGYSGY
jgi:predicted lipoprotein with Yx(FWY)xxD motif